jgi:hypothetical protein
MSFESTSNSSGVRSATGVVHEVEHVVVDRRVGLLGREGRLRWWGCPVAASSRARHTCPAVRSGPLARRGLRTRCRPRARLRDDRHRPDGSVTSVSTLDVPKAPRTLRVKIESICRQNPEKLLCLTNLNHWIRVKSGSACGGNVARAGQFAAELARLAPRLSESCALAAPWGDPRKLQSVAERAMPHN